MAVDTETFEDYGEQCADTDGLALRDAFERGNVATYHYVVSDGHEADTDGMANVRAVADVGFLCEQTVALESRLANRDRTIDTLMTQLIGKDATIAGLRTEAQRLSELAQGLQAQLNARHGAAGEPQTGASTPCETPRVNPFAHGWATKHRLRG